LLLLAFMRLPLAAALCVSLLAPTVHAGKAPAKRATATAARRSTASKKPAPPKKIAAKKTAPKAVVTRLDDEERGKLAIDAVKKSLKPWMKPGEKVTIRAGIVPFNGDPRNPITGAGPVEVFVTAKDDPSAGFWKRLKAKLNPYGKQKYLVHVSADGEANVLERISLAPQRRFARFLATKLPIGTLVIDFIKSDKLSAGIGTALGATGSAMVSPALSGAMWMWFAHTVREGVKGQQEVRIRAMDATVEWARNVNKDVGSFPTLMETYRSYRFQVESQQTGARPLELCRFAEALSIRNL
jgi:hypothetical protein